MASMVNVLPLPVWPYMNSAPMPPFRAPVTMGAAAVWYTSVDSVPSPNARVTSKPECLTNIRLRSGYIWQLCTKISVGDASFSAAAGTVTTSNSPRSTSCWNSGRFLTYTRMDPSLAAAADALALALVVVPDRGLHLPAARLFLHRCTAAQKGLAFIRRDSRLSNICRVFLPSVLPSSLLSLVTTTFSAWPGTPPAATGFLGALSTLASCFLAASAASCASIMAPVTLPLVAATKGAGALGAVSVSALAACSWRRRNSSYPMTGFCGACSALTGLGLSFCAPLLALGDSATWAFLVFAAAAVGEVA
mmetsp:Transcript_2689/g.10508  ORF Transcript_2689/g.10508 Transcript_2689/m.10508 type:complete len:306 (-) Transcript_2689:582-1499(-)